MHNISRFGKLFLALGFLLAALGLAFHAVRAKKAALPPLRKDGAWI